MASLNNDIERGMKTLQNGRDEEKRGKAQEADIEKGENPEPKDVHHVTGISYIRSLFTVLILALINLVSFMDRFMSAGIMTELQEAFDMDDIKIGLLNTVFVLGFLLLAPVFGYLGDRWNRKCIVSGGIAIWSAISLASSFIPHEYYLLMILRGLLGAVEASFTVVAPSIIADLFEANRRGRMLSIYYFTIPVGCGLGYISGDRITSIANGDWRWAFRVTPCLGFVAFLLLIFISKEPPVGAAVRRPSFTPLTHNDWLSNMKSLCKNRSFIFSTLGSTAVSFVVGAIGLWAPTLLERVQIYKGKCLATSCKTNDNLYFGIITVVSGLLGVLAGVEISKRYKKVNPRSDPLICALGLIASAPFLFLALLLGEYSIEAAYVLIFIAETLICLNWALVTDILLAVVPPTLRNTAEALQTTVSHLLGDAGSPYLVGMISEVLRSKSDTAQLYYSLQFTLMGCAFVLVLGGGLFLATALYIERDKEKVELTD